MAYIDGFEHDIFISYARVNNQRGWVDHFHRELEIALSERVGRKFGTTLFLDTRKIGEHLRFDLTIKDAIKSSAVFLALTSKGYQASDYCEKELVWYYREASDHSFGLTVGDRSRMINVLLNNIPPDQWPEGLRGMAGFSFHDGQRPEDFGEPYGHETPQFKQQVRKLANALHGLLEAMKDTVPLEGNRHTELPFIIFMADVGENLRRLRRRVIKELKQSEIEIEIVSDDPPDDDTLEDHDPRVSKVLKGVNLSIHLLGKSPGEEIDEDDDRTYPQRQVELAIDHAKAQIIWVPQDLDMEDIKDETHRSFMQQLKPGARDEQPYEFIRTARVPTDIAQDILGKIEELQRVPEPVEDGPGGSSTCLLVTHMNDTDHFLQVTTLLKKHGIKMMFNLEGSDPEDEIRLFQSRLRQVKNLIIIFGDVPTAWVQERLKMAGKIAAMEDLDLGLAAYIAPHKRLEDIKSGLPRYSNVHMLEDLNPDELLAFLNGGQP